MPGIPQPSQTCRAPFGTLAKAVLVVLCAATMPGCTSCRDWVANGFKVGPNYCTPAVQVAPDWIDADDKRVLSDPVNATAWWTTFNDPVLNQLITDAYGQNLTVRQAGARIMQARALRAITVGELFPQQQDFSAQYSHNLRTGVGDRHFSNWNGQFALAWEIDFWGRYRRAVEAADADLDASIYDFGDVVVTLVADVAATYIDIRTLQARLELVRQNVDNQRQTYDLTVLRRDVGKDYDDVDVEQARSSLLQTEALVPELEIFLRQSQNQLCVLLGRPPEDIEELLGEGEIPSVEPEIALGIPAATLLQRPDVRRAERDLAAQSALIGVAESELYPHITLTGNVGRSANQFKDLFRSGSGFGSVGPSLNWDILNYGRLLNNIRFQDARFQELLAVYRQQVLLANLEAENAIIQFLRSQEQFKIQLEAAEAADRTNELIRQQFQEGEDIDFNRVFNVQNFKTQQELSAAAVKGDVAQSVIAIYRALGGGWPSPYLRQPAPVMPEPAAEAIEAPPADGELPIDEELENPAGNISE